MEITPLQKEFLKLAVVQQYSYDEIETILNIPRKELSLWWNNLKDTREKLSKIRRIWLSKNPTIDLTKEEQCNKFYDFKNWFELSKKECYYCHISEKELKVLWEKAPFLTKRKRGKKLEIERKVPNQPYLDIENLVYSCYWCNNGKTDTFTESEFKEIGQVISKIWKKRLLH